MKIRAKERPHQSAKNLVDGPRKKKYSLYSTSAKINTILPKGLNFEEHILNKDTENTSRFPVYNKKILKLLDDLECPVLLLPRIKSGNSIKKIGFFTDIRFTGIPTIATIVKIAKSFQAGLTLFNFAESAIPEMDPDFANFFFLKKGMSKVNGMEVDLVNIEKDIAYKNLEFILDNQNIDMIATMNTRKDLLYKLELS
jgi:hypothetical protein